MRKYWSQAVGMAILLAALGCRTYQPNLKPPEVAETLNAPPTEHRFNTASMPKEAFNNRDPLKKLNAANQEIMPVRGNMGGPGGLR